MITVVLLRPINNVSLIFISLAPTTTLGLSTVGNVDMPSTECERGQSDSTKENFPNWLSGDAANNLFKDDPDQCINQ